MSACLSSPRAFTRRASRIGVFTALPLAAAVSSHAASWCGDRCDQVVLDWNAKAHQVVKAADGYRHPLGASRALAMMHLAMHDAANAVRPRYRPYAYKAATVTAPHDGDAGDAAVAAAVAAHDVMASLYPKQQELLRATLETTLHDAGHGAAMDRARGIGAEAASAMLGRRASDGSQADEAWLPTAGPGHYRYVPGTSFVFAPHWRAVTPFTLQSPDQFRVPPPPALDSAAYAVDFDEVKATGRKDGDARRSPDQTRYAAFWYETSEAGWNRIARTVARERRQDVWDRARTFALLNAVLADAYIAGWDSKLHHDLWRPVTAVAQAADDGNAATQPEAGWTPLLPTPPVQDYPSTHSALGGAAAAVLAHAYGSDSIRFTVASPTADPKAPTRTFAGFGAAARENADSRVRAGLHFRFATTQGLTLGEQIGRQAVATMLGAYR